MKTSGILASCALALFNTQTSIATPLNDTAIAPDNVHDDHHPSGNASAINITSSLGGESVPFESCKDFDSVHAGFLVNEISLSPNPPVRGRDLDITIKGDLRQQMDKGAMVRVAVWKFGMSFITLEFDWCSNIQGLTCPVQPGNVTFSKTQDIDSKIPPWTFLLTVETINQAGNKVSCLQLETQVAMDDKKRPKGSVAEAVDE